MRTQAKTLAGSTLASVIGAAALLAGGIAVASAAELEEPEPVPTVAWLPAVELDRATERVRERLRAAERRQERRKRERQERRFASPESVGVSPATLEAIAACESGGNPAAVSADGTYRGKYQFSRPTWAAVGGSGDPAAASVAEQDYRAALLYTRAGPSQWPVCG